MSTDEQALNAEPRADLAVSQGEPDPAASLGIDETPAPSQPAEEPLPSSALSRNITATQRLIENTEKQIEVSKAKRDSPNAIATLQRERRFLVDRKQHLQQLWEHEQRKSALDAR